MGVEKAQEQRHAEPGVELDAAFEVRFEGGAARDHVECAGACLGLLLHGTGNYPSGSEIDVTLVYGDYYFVEALARYKAAHVTPVPTVHLIGIFSLGLALVSIGLRAQRVRSGR